MHKYQRYSLVIGAVVVFYVGSLTINDVDFEMSSLIKRLLIISGLTFLAYYKFKKQTKQDEKVSKAINEAQGFVLFFGVALFFHEIIDSQEILASKVRGRIIVLILTVVLLFLAFRGLDLSKKKKMRNHE